MLKTEVQIVTNGQKIFGFFTSKRGQGPKAHIIEPCSGDRTGQRETKVLSSLKTSTSTNQPPGATRAASTNRKQSMHQHQQTYRPAPAPSTGAAFTAALATIALFALIGAMIAA